MTTVEHVRFCSVGVPFDGAAIKIEDPDEEGQGEVCGEGGREGGEGEGMFIEGVRLGEGGREGRERERGM